MFNITYVIELCTAHCTCTWHIRDITSTISPSLYQKVVVSAVRGYFRDKLDNGTIRMLAAFPGSLDATCHLPLSLSLPTETKCGKNVTNAGRGEKECRGQRKHLSLRHPSIQLELKYDRPSKYHSCDDINGAFSYFMIGQGRVRRGRGRTTNNDEYIDKRRRETLIVKWATDMRVTLANCKQRIVVIGSGTGQQSLVLSFRLQFSSLGRLGPGLLRWVTNDGALRLAVPRPPARPRKNQDRRTRT